VLEEASSDLSSSTRAGAIELVDQVPDGVDTLTNDEDLVVAITRPEIGDPTETDKHIR
jgi:hypothetical protein